MTAAASNKLPREGFLAWVKGGEALVWFNAASVTLSVMAVIGLLTLLAIKGFGHFWPDPVLEATLVEDDGERRFIGEVFQVSSVSAEQLLGSGYQPRQAASEYRRLLIKQGNRDFMGPDFAWVLEEQLQGVTYPEAVVVFERTEWGNLYGYLETLRDNEPGAKALSADWPALQQAIAEATALRRTIRQIERTDIAALNRRSESLLRQERDTPGSLTPEQRLAVAEDQRELELAYEQVQQQLRELYRRLDDRWVGVRLADGQLVEIPAGSIVRAFRPNALGLVGKLRLYLQKFWEFVSDEPREGSTEGGVFPAIFGTVMMVFLMSIVVTPFGMLAAVYLHEYARQSWATRVVRIAVNNLAGVPSIVYGVFGLGFFVYFLGGELDQLFFAEALPRPTFGTPGLMWASLTLALLTLPVVIVATEEGLTRIPGSLREGSLALGATQAETLWRVVLPMASPAMMTGVILAVARAAGEVAPLMLVGVVKLAPTLPVDGTFPYLHLEQQFMHLGFHIYDVGFQSPNVEAARPLVYATALLLVIIIAGLNFAAVSLRNRLRERYKALEQ